MLARQVSGLCEPLADNVNSRGDRFRDAQRGIAQREHSLGMHILAEDTVYEVVGFFNRKSGVRYHGPYDDLVREKGQSQNVRLTNLH